jgi:hypothetical protein
MIVASIRKPGLALGLLALITALAMCAGSEAQQKAAKKKKARVEPAVVQPVWNDQQLDQWIFQNAGRSSNARDRLTSLLTLHIDDVDRATKLTEAQRKKLQLAGQGDIKRFFDLYEGVKRKFQAIKNDQQKINQIWQDIQPLQIAVQGSFFREESLFYKSLPNTLNNEQFKRYDVVAQKRREFGHRAHIELAVTMLEQSTPLRHEQRQKLIDFLVHELKPAPKAGAMQYYLVMYQASQIPEAKLKPMFDDFQWKVVDRQLAQYKQYKQYLKQTGQLPEEDEEARADGDSATRND